MKSARKWWSAGLAVLFVIAIVASGCGKTQTAKEILESALEANLKMESYHTSATMQLHLEAPDSMLQDPELAGILAMLKNAELHMNGVYQKDPLQMEMTLDLQLKGDMSMSISLPIVMTQDTIWIKIPNIPMLAGLIPQELVGKFIKMDMNELNELSGGELASPSLLDIDGQQKLGLELFKAASDTLDDKYFTVLNKKDAGLPEAAKAEQAVQFQLKDDNVEEALKALIKEGVPQVLDILSKPENMALMQISAEDIEQMRKDVQVSDQELDEALQQVWDVLKIHEFTFKVGVDKNNFTTYQETKIDAEIMNGNETVKVELVVIALNDRINEEPTFEIGIPSEEDSIDLMDLTGGFMF